MQITHIAGIDLAANGWSIVADPMLAGNAGDNWQQTELGLFADYPRPFQITLLTQSPSRTTIEQRLTALLREIDARRDYHATPPIQLRMQITYNATGYYVPFWPDRLQAGILQWSGSAYVQTVTIAGMLMSPPWRMTSDVLTIASFPGLSSYNATILTFPGSTTWWSPGSINMSSSTAASLGVFGGMWMADLERDAPAIPLQSISVVNSTPSSTAITIGATTARQMATAGAYTFSWGFFTSVPPPYDVWLHLHTPSGTATAEITINDTLVTTIVATPRQLCYYAGRMYAGMSQFRVIVTTTVANTVLYPVVFSHAPVCRVVTYIPATATVLETNQVYWHNRLINPFGSLVQATTNNRRELLVGNTECWMPRNMRFLATWRQHAETISAVLTRYPVVPGVI